MSYFDYIMQLDRAIDATCQDLQSAGRLEIAGLDLTEAYKRLLYFRYRDSSSLFGYLADDAVAMGRASLALDIESRLAGCLNDNNQRPAVSRWHSALEIIKNFRFFVARRAFEANRSLPPGSRPKILLVPSSDKFTNFLMPLRERLGLRAHFAGKAVGEQLAPHYSQAICASNWRLACRKPWPFDPPGYRTLSSLCAGIYSVIVAHRPQCLVVAEGNAPGDAVVGIVGKKLGIPVVCIQQGWSPFMHVGFKKMPYDKFCVWGSRFREVLETENEPRIFVTTGAHQLDCAERASATRNSVGVLLQNPPSCTGRFGLIDEPAWNLSLGIIREVIQKLPEIEFRLRPHPGSQDLDLRDLGLEGFNNVKYMPPKREPISQFFNAVDISISAYSTTLYESIHAGVWPIILDIVGLPTFTPDLVSERVAGLASSPDGLVPLIRRFYQDPGWRERQQFAIRSAAPKYFAAAGEAALDNMAKCIRGQLN